MRLRKSTISLVVFACWCLIAICLNAKNLQGAEIKPDMKLHGSKIINVTNDNLGPRKLTVDRGTTVIWLNNTQSIMEIEFTGKQVTLACGAPVRFFVNESGSFTSHKILPNGVASLCFIDEGEYDYEVKFLPFGGGQGPGAIVKRPNKGKVIVK